MSWDGKYEDFATYIMMVNLENYLESQKRKQEKKLKRALASYEASMEKEPTFLPENPHTALPSPKKPATVLLSVKAHTTSPEPKEAPMTNKELSARILQLQAIGVKKRTLAEAEELERLLTRRKKRSQ